MITCYIISVAILAQTIAALSSPISAPTELSDFSLASPWLQHVFQRLQSSPTSPSSSGAASSSDAAVYTTAELRIRIHEEKLWLELEELADEAIERQIARFGFDRELRANCMASVDKAVQAYKLLRDSHVISYP